MPSTSTTTIFPPRVIGRVVKIPYGEKECLSKVLRIVGDGVIDGEPRAF